LGIHHQTFFGGIETGGDNSASVFPF